MSALNSIRTRLGLIAALIISLALSAAAIGLMYLFRAHLEQRLAAELSNRVIDLAGSFELSPDEVPQLRRELSDPRYRIPLGGAYWYVRDGDAIVLRSRSMWDFDIPKLNGPASTITETPGPEESSLYVFERPVTLTGATGERKFTLGTALEKKEIDALSSSFARQMAMGIAGIGLLLFAGAWFQVRYGLRPLKSIREQLPRLHSGELQELRGPFPTEVSALTNELNALFDNQRDSLRRARERAGNLAHGLKTPLTVMSGISSELVRGGHPRAGYILKEQLQAINHLVERELSRARAHGTAAGIGLTADVTGTAERLVQVMQRMPRGSDIEWNITAEPVFAAIDPDDLGEVLGNLLDNARKWARSRVDFGAVETSDHVSITVADDGPGIPPDLADSVQERGTVLPGSNGSGLGLSIVAEMIKPYGAQIKVAKSEMGGAELSFMLPRRN
jgi:signal transduction histidine kinase